ncbi:MAG: type I glyceraldehyde-3-phosphate dehydrogenase [Deltaproteobacteria bacterium]|nr:type I glyceraldehyde-3-phosphate dehydrogenase [Deltaproteobacteria bacterium]
MSVRLAINGFGRVGRYLVRACLGYEDIEVVAVNTRAKPAVLAHLLKYDSVHGKIRAEVSADDDGIIVNGKKIKVLGATTTPADLPWRDLGIDVLVESTGKFTKREDVVGHISAGARKVILAAPGKGMDGTFVMGVNEGTYDPAKHNIVSNASCTTNCLAPVAKILNDNFGIVKGLMTTVHSYTMDQRLLDGSHKDLRRGRAAAMSIVPTSTGAAAAVAEVIPALKGKLDGLALRVPTPNVSLVDLSVELGKTVTAQEVNAAFKEAASGSLKGLLQFCEEELVSIDFMSSSYSSIVDAALTKVIAGNFVKVFSWYDNESGYACRIRDLALYIGKKGA